MNGNVYVTGPAGIWILASGGKILGILQTPDTATNLNWGGSDRNVLFITTAREDFTRSALYRIKLSVHGHI